MRQILKSRVMNAGLLTIAASLALSACQQADESAAENVAVESTSEAVADAEMAASDAGSVPAARSSENALPELAGVPVSLPKLAYIYDYAFRMAGEDIGTLQRRHADLCEQQGPASCQIIGMNVSGETGDEVTGELQLSVATQHARAFGALLEKEAGDAGAEQLTANIQAEEMSRAIVDTEARLDARIALRDRLQDVLKTRKGSVRELVEAERGVAEVNEEIDQARSWLKEMKGRVAYSRVNIRYETGAVVTNDFLAPIQSALGSLGSIFGFLIAAFILLGAIAVPVGGMVLGGRALKRRLATTAEVRA